MLRLGAWMEKFVNSEILEKLDDIIKDIQENDTYQEYQFLFQKLLKHEKANILIKKVKSIQKEMIKKEIKKESISELEKEMNSILDELDLIPLYVEFVSKQQELNQIYQDVKEKLDCYFFGLLS